MDNSSGNVLAIIPARGGSRGIFRKNTALLGGKPLIAYSIIAALKSRLIDKIVVSTDDEEIAGIAKHYGAEVPFMRPKELAGDRSSVSDAVEYTIDKLADGGFEAGIRVCLFPTSPFRSVEMMDRMIENVKYRAVTSITVKPLRYKHSGLFTISHKGRRGTSANDNTQCNVSCVETLVKENELSNLYKQIGLICVETVFPREIRCNVFSISKYIKDMAERGYEKFKKWVIYEVVDDPITHIDIDTPEDLALAKEVIKRGLYV